MLHIDNIDMLHTLSREKHSGTLRSEMSSPMSMCCPETRCLPPIWRLSPASFHADVTTVVSVCFGGKSAVF